VLRAEARQRADVDAFLALARGAFEEAGGVVARGPLPAPLPRRAGYVRGQLLVESRQRPALHRALAATIDGLRARRQARRVRWSIDVDPVDLY
jgi:primosomal protein N' (replication factor Y)